MINTTQKSSIHLGERHLHFSLISLQLLTYRISIYFLKKKSIIIEEGKADNENSEANEQDWPSTEEVDNLLPFPTLRRLSDLTPSQLDEGLSVEELRLVYGITCCFFLYYNNLITILFFTE